MSICLVRVLCSWCCKSILKTIVLSPNRLMVSLNYQIVRVSLVTEEVGESGVYIEDVRIRNMHVARWFCHITDSDFYTCKQKRLLVPILNGWCSDSLYSNSDHVTTWAFAV